MKGKIKRLYEIRRELTKIYIELGNPKDMSADMILGEEIVRLEEKCVNDAKDGSK